MLAARGAATYPAGEGAGRPGGGRRRGAPRSSTARSRRPEPGARAGGSPSGRRSRSRRTRARRPWAAGGRAAGRRRARWPRRRRRRRPCAGARSSAVPAARRRGAPEPWRASPRPAGRGARPCFALLRAGARAGAGAGGGPGQAALRSGERARSGGRRRQQAGGRGLCAAVTLGSTCSEPALRGSGTEPATSKAKPARCSRRRRRPPAPRSSRSPPPLSRAPRNGRQAARAPASASPALPRRGLWGGRRAAPRSRPGAARPWTQPAGGHFAGGGSGREARSLARSQGRGGPSARGASRAASVAPLGAPACGPHRAPRRPGSAGAALAGTCSVTSRRGGGGDAPQGLLPGGSHGWLTGGPRGGSKWGCGRPAPQRAPGGQSPSQELLGALGSSPGSARAPPCVAQAGVQPRKGSRGLPVRLGRGPQRSRWPPAGRQAGWLFRDPPGRRECPAQIRRRRVPVFAPQEAARRKRLACQEWSRLPGGPGRREPAEPIQEEAGQPASQPAACNQQVQKAKAGKGQPAWPWAQAPPSPCQCASVPGALQNLPALPLPPSWLRLGGASSQVGQTQVRGSFRSGLPTLAVALQGLRQPHLQALLWTNAPILSPPPPHPKQKMSTRYPVEGLTGRL